MIEVYRDPLVVLYQGDAADLDAVPTAAAAQLLVIDPPFDDDDAYAVALPEVEHRLVFTDPRRLGGATTRYGPPDWLFVWDTMNSWQAGPRRPLTQTKFAAYYGPFHDGARDGGAVDAPRQNRSSNPSTPRRLDGAKSLPDVWRESLRWLHADERDAPAGDGEGASRFRRDARTSPMRFAKPIGWLRYLFATCAPGGLVLDPFAGSGSSLIAARALDRPAIGVELDPDVAEFAAARLRGETGRDPSQSSLF